MPFLRASGLSFFMTGERFGPLGVDDSDFDPSGVSNLPNSDKSGTELFLRIPRSVHMCVCVCAHVNTMKQQTTAQVTRH